MMQNEGARMEIMIAALFALVVFQQVQIAHLNTRLINVLENQATTTTLERRTATRQHGATGTPANHFRHGHYMGPFDITLPRKIAANVHPTAPLESLPWQQLALCLLGLITAAVWMPGADLVRRIFKRQTQPDSAQPEFQSQNAAQKSRRKKKKQKPASASESERPKSPTDEPLKAGLAPAPEMQPDSASLHAELQPKFRAKLELPQQSYSQHQDTG